MSMLQLPRSVNTDRRSRSWPEHLPTTRKLHAVLELARPLSSLSFQRTTKLTKQQKDQYSLAQRDPAAFFEEIKNRLLAYQAENCSAAKIRGLSQSLSVRNKVSFSLSGTDQRTVDDDSLAVLDSQIAKTIDDADNSLYESKSQHRYRSSCTSKTTDNRNYFFPGQSFTRSDSGVGTDTSEK